jgi:hypothetical protein
MRDLKFRPKPIHRDRPLIGQLTLQFQSLTNFLQGERYLETVASDPAPAACDKKLALYQLQKRFATISKYQVLSNYKCVI